MRSEPPREPGFARREAHKPERQRDRQAIRRLLKRQNDHPRPEGEGPLGNQGFPHAHAANRRRTFSVMRETALS